MKVKIQIWILILILWLSHKAWHTRVFTKPVLRSKRCSVKTVRMTLSYCGGWHGQGNDLDKMTHVLVSRIWTNYEKGKTKMGWNGWQHMQIWKKFLMFIVSSICHVICSSKYGNPSYQLTLFRLEEGGTLGSDVTLRKNGCHLFDATIRGWVPH